MRNHIEGAFLHFTECGILREHPKAFLKGKVLILHDEIRNSHLFLKKEVI